MGAWVHSETFLLDLANIAVGAATLACLFWVAYGIALELVRLPRVGSKLARDDDHALLTPDLGLTMADGGRRIAGRKPPVSWRRRAR